MSTSQNRRQKREMARFRAMPADKLVRKIKKVLPNIPDNPNYKKAEMTYGEWLDSIEITPEMLKELEQHDLNDAKSDEDFTGYSKPTIINAQNRTKRTDFDFEEVKF
jgi:hypothetical protein